ncbi:MAG: efflux RND transporter periplasmic adaptor subunit [Ignavibacteriales bacterium]
MKRKWYYILPFFLLLFLLGVFFSIKKFVERKPRFEFATVQFGSIKKTITSTGMLQPRSKVAIGTQVSGTFSKIYITYNDVVKKGQLLAELDKTLLLAALDEARAQLLSAREKVAASNIEFKKNLQLYNKGFLSEQDFIKSRAGFYSDSSALLIAKANLKRAETNIDYAAITSPINGTIIEKNVEVGQTVAANFNTPTLFVIAEDLSKMEIQVSVDESDISSIFTGQPAEFSVLAYPDSLFKGRVSQIRMHPQIVQNVVTYIVVINCDNNYNILLPGMTATVDFILNEKKDLLLMPKGALNFRMPENISGDFYSKMQSSKPSQNENKNIQYVWYLNNNNELALKAVETGTSDDNNVEITGSKDFRPGQRVICGIIEDEPDGSSSSQKQRLSNDGMQGSGGPPPPPGGI